MAAVNISTMAIKGLAIGLSMLAVVTLLLTACSNESPVPSAGERPALPVVPRSSDFAQLHRGGQLFQHHCAVCHGAQAQGAPNWQQRTADGRFPAPPLDGSGHAWHHSTRVLIDVIKNGTQRIGGNMPAWKAQLNEAQIHDVIAWFQAKWSDDIYVVWYKREQQSKDN